MNGAPPREEACFAAFRAHVVREAERDFGIRHAEWLHRVAEDWFRCDARHDHRFVEMEARLPAGTRFLDLASGMGTAVLRGLHRGLDGFGVEPDADKIALTCRRIETGNFPPEWLSRFTRATGEKLPFKDGTFDAVLSYQTLEHVADPSAVVAEMLRVLRPGGGMHIRCPDYTGTFEGHYLLPWLPLFPRRLAGLYLRLLGRPVAGLREIRYVTRRRVVHWLKAGAARRGVDIHIEDLERGRLRGRLREGGFPGWRGPAFPWRMLHRARRLFREEIQINLWVSVPPAAGSRRPQGLRATTR